MRFAPGELSSLLHPSLAVRTIFSLVLFSAPSCSVFRSRLLAFLHVIPLHLLFLLFLAFVPSSTTRIVAPSCVTQCHQLARRLCRAYSVRRYARAIHCQWVGYIVASNENKLKIEPRLDSRGWQRLQSHERNILFRHVYKIDLRSESSRSPMFIRFFTDC